MDSKNIIASALTDNELARAFSELVAERWDNWDLTEFLPYLVDTCAATVLPYLADQFDVDGLRGFEMVDDESQQREIIKKSIALHKFIGTPWAIREACRTVGFPVIVLEEGVTATPGGPTSPEDWARFRVLIQDAPTRHVTQEEARKLRLFVEFYKNERSHLVELGFFQPFTDNNVYHNPVDQRENIEVDTLTIFPNPIILNPAGHERAVEVEATTQWAIDGNTFDWDDGSADTFTLEYIGNSGTSLINVTSSTNNTGSDREKTIAVKTQDGRIFGQLTVRQTISWSNAYSRAYSNAYNTF